MNCFRPILTPKIHINNYFSVWCTNFGNEGLSKTIADDQCEALSRLVPILLCGEQSAVTAFYREAEKDLNDILFGIAADELSHEAALQLLYKSLPKASDLDEITKRSRDFFKSLGNAGSVEQHFAQIAQLDSAVFGVMKHVEKSKVAEDDFILSLATQIKMDEARHVGLCRRYAKELGVTEEEYQRQGDLARESLIQLLMPVSDSLETIGIDTDNLYATINRTGSRSF